jgi:hypothetical protein
MKVTPQTVGKLSLLVQMAEEENYWACLEYDVQ